MMGCDYMLGAKCKYRKNMGTQELFNLQKIAAQFPSNGTYADHFVGTTTMYTPNGPVRRTLNATDVRNAFNTVKEMADGECKKCPCNFMQRGGGCYSFLKYPLTIDLEKAIASYMDSEARKLEHAAQSDFFNMLISEYALPNIPLYSQKSRAMQRGFMMADRAIVFDAPIFPKGRINMDMFWDAFLFPRDARKEEWIVYSKRNRKVNSQFAKGLGTFLDVQEERPILKSFTGEPEYALKQFATFCNAICIADRTGVDLMLSP